MKPGRESLKERLIYQLSKNSFIARYISSYSTTGNRSSFEEKCETK